MAHDGLGLYYWNRNRFTLVVMDKYTKALEQARNYYPDNLFLDTIFPELSESEDERIRKELFEKVGCIIPEEGEYNDDGLISPAYYKRIERYRAYLEKQKEQKPMNNPKWNQLTWKDINELEEIINCVHSEFRNGISAEGFGKEVLEQFRNMKEDAEVDACEQQSAEWSEEDKNMLNSIIATCQLAAQDRDSGPARHLLGMQERFLKSLRPQPHWKPSEKQMNALKHAYSMMGGQAGTDLANLYYDLKKL